MGGHAHFSWPSPHAGSPGDHRRFLRHLSIQGMGVLRPFAVAAAVFVVALSYRGHTDAATFFRRTAVYGTLTVLTIFGFGVLESGIASALGNRLPGGTPPAVAAGTVAVLLHPAKRICDRVTDPLLKWLWGWAAQSPR